MIKAALRRAALTVVAMLYMTALLVVICMPILAALWIGQKIVRHFANWPWVDIGSWALVVAMVVVVVTGITFAIREAYLLSKELWP